MPAYRRRLELLSPERGPLSAAVYCTVPQPPQVVYRRSSSSSNSLKNSPGENCEFRAAPRWPSASSSDAAAPRTRRINPRPAAEAQSSIAGVGNPRGLELDNRIDSSECRDVKDRRCRRQGRPPSFALRRRTLPWTAEDEPFQSVQRCEP